jgi:sugar-phosphatase
MNHEKLAVIFDMDGLIIDSEPLWRSAEISVFNTMGYQFTEAMCIQTMGMRIDSVVKFWHKKFKWQTPSIDSVVNNIQNKVIDLVNNQGNPLDGVITTIDLLKRNNIPIAIASSSSTKIINAVVDKLNIKDKFDVIHSAENEKKWQTPSCCF